MNPTAEQIQKINHFSKVTLGLCEKIASAVKIIEWSKRKAIERRRHWRYNDSGVSRPSRSQ